MKNEERIIELLIETLQKVDRHQEILKEHIRLWKEQNKRWDEQNLRWQEQYQRLDDQNQRWDEQNQRWREQQDTNNLLLESLRVEMQELQRVSYGQTRNNLIDEEQSRRIETLHQTWLEEQKVLRDMMDLLMAQNKALKDNGLL